MFAPRQVTVEKQSGKAKDQRVMTAVPSVAAAAVELGKTFSGQLLEPGNAAYEEARKVHNGLVDKRPALIAQCADAIDVGQCHQAHTAARSRSGGPRRWPQRSGTCHHRWRPDDRP